MIAALEGQIAEVSDSAVVIMVDGVGYEVHCSSNTTACLELESKRRLHIYTDMTEGRIRLYGFSERLEKGVFLLLIQVNGLGPKTALEILSSVEINRLLQTIVTADVAELRTIKGIGKKTAERIIVELRDKIASFESSYAALGDAALGDGVAGAFPGARVVTSRGMRGGTLNSELERDAVMGLQSLGFPQSQAQQVVAQVMATHRSSHSGEASSAGDSGLNVSMIVTEALKTL